MEAYFVSNNGLGDNIYSIGALRYLLKFYNKIYFICSDRYIHLVKDFFIDTENIICVPFDSTNQIKSCKKIMNKYRDTHDILVSGWHKRFIKSKVTNKKFLKARKLLTSGKYYICHDTINKRNYGFIAEFYKHNGLNLRIFFEYFHLPKTDESKQLYDSVKDYKIIFLQTTSSNGKKLHIKDLCKKNILDSNTIMISNDENLYDSIEEPNEEIIKKRELCQKFIRTNLTYYLDTIINSSEIYIIDSCFVGIVLPLLKTNKLMANNVRIILRDEAKKIKL